MKSLADIKRAMQVGSVWHGYSHLFNEDLGEREISIRQTNMVAFKTPKKGTENEFSDSWWEFPKASNIKFIDENTFDVLVGGEKRLTYKLIKQAK